MITAGRFIAEVPPAYRIDGIRWLVLEYDEKDSKGWFLFGHRSLDEASEFDHWYQTRNEAEQQAALQWGVNQNAWKARSVSDV
jgi:hypothetical protein